MNDHVKYYTIKAMEYFGGSFVQALARAYSVADAENANRIETAFPEYLEEYGPTGKFYDAAK
jgi:hypothetical protein